MSQSSNGTIIEFRRAQPTPPARAPEGAPELDPRERLRRALATLDQAVVEQRAAVARWRESLAELRGSLAGLGASLGGYNARLGVLAEDVAGLNQQARRMEALADRLLATRRSADPDAS